MMYQLSVSALWQPVRQYALHQAFFIMCSTQCEDEWRLVFRQEEVTLNISSDTCTVFSSWHYRCIQCNSVGVSDCTSITNRSDNSLKLHYCATCNLNTCETIVPDVSQFIPAIRMCWRVLSKYTLGQLCNYTFPDPCCFTLFFVSLYEESILEVLLLSFDTPYIY
jgi:hypothetical protein